MHISQYITLKTWKESSQDSNEERHKFVIDVRASTFIGIFIDSTMMPSLLALLLAIYSVSIKGMVPDETEVKELEQMVDFRSEILTLFSFTHFPLFLSSLLPLTKTNSVH